MDLFHSCDQIKYSFVSKLISLPNFDAMFKIHKIILKSKYDQMGLKNVNVKLSHNLRDNDTITPPSMKVITTLKSARDRTSVTLIFRIQPLL